MQNFPLPRIDEDEELKNLIKPYCRFKEGKIWKDTHSAGHRIGCLDAADEKAINKLMAGHKAAIAVHDPPYNFIAFGEREVNKFINWCSTWIDNTFIHLNEDASFYVWLGADQNNNFEPLPDFMKLMSTKKFKSRSYITMRNQRGYGTSKNWMAVRQELLYYVKGNACFNVEAEYTGIPKILRGYYKNVNGQKTENLERSKSENIRAGNVWVDIQQVFYRMEENVSGCYAQKPLKSIERILSASSNEKDIVLDFFSHSGTTLLASEKLNRTCFTVDSDPVYCEITLRRLENFRKNKKTGWQNSNPFQKEILSDKKLFKYLQKLSDKRKTESKIE